MARFADGGETAVGGVDVQPEIVLVAEVGDLWERVDRTSVGGTCVGTNQQRLQPVASVVRDSPFELDDVELALRSLPHNLQGTLGEAENRSGLDR